MYFRVLYVDLTSLGNIRGVCTADRCRQGCWGEAFKGQGREKRSRFKSCSIKKL